jgi:glycosyltransferase involved in cell wall biosynthesis
MKIFCIVPAYNEEKNIKKTIKDLKETQYEIIIVDDCSCDNTYKVAKENTKYVIRHPINRGQGAALETGNQYAKKLGADIVVHFDADGQFLVKEIKDIVEPIVNGECDVVFGSRFLGKKSNMPWFKEQVIMRLGRLMNKIIFNIDLTDPQNGFRAMNLKALNKIKIQNDGSAHCSEIIYKTVKNKLKYKEIPITVIYNEFGQGILGGKGRGTGGLRILRDLFIGKIIE